jgi:hypothetical protein
MEKSLLVHFLPSLLLEYFEITSISEKIETTKGSSKNETIIEIELEEKNKIPSGYDDSEYESKGFLPAKRVQDFPIRGKSVYLLIKCRRWRHKINKNEIIQNDYSLVADGSRLTQELSDFLKGIGRDPRRYD